MKRWIALFAVVLLLALPEAAVAQSGDPSLSGWQSMGTGVTIANFAFQPSYIVVAPGTTVSWYNADGAPHTVTSDVGAFDSGTIGSGGGYSLTFSTPSTYTYHCAIHPMMTGTVVVSGM